MRDEIWISAGSKFEKIHSLTFALDGDTLWQHSIEQPVQRVRQGEYKAEQGGNADELCQELA